MKPLRQVSDRGIHIVASTLPWILQRNNNTCLSSTVYVQSILPMGSGSFCKVCKTNFSTIRQVVNGYFINF